MFGVALFLGFPIDKTFSKELASIDAKVAAMFIRNDTQEYLQEIVFQETRYLGRFAGEMSDSTSLALLEANIYSLLKRIVPHYPSEETPLVLFPATISQ